MNDPSLQDKQTASCTMPYDLLLKLAINVATLCDIWNWNSTNWFICQPFISFSLWLNVVQNNEVKLSDINFINVQVNDPLCIHATIRCLYIYHFQINAWLLLHITYIIFSKHTIDTNLKIYYNYCEYRCSSVINTALVEFDDLDYCRILALF